MVSITLLSRTQCNIDNFWRFFRCNILCKFYFFLYWRWARWRLPRGRGTGGSGWRMSWAPCPGPRSLSAPSAQSRSRGKQVWISSLSFQQCAVSVRIEIFFPISEFIFLNTDDTRRCERGCFGKFRPWPLSNFKNNIFK